MQDTTLGFLDLEFVLQALTLITRRTTPRKGPGKASSFTAAVTIRLLVVFNKRIDGIQPRVSPG
jgi:hypothetical protein